MTDREMPVFGRRRTVLRRLRNGFLAMAAFTVALPARQLRTPPSSIATMRSCAECGDLLRTCAIPWRPWASDAEGNNGMV